MRELTVRIRFTRHCLGNAHDRQRIDGKLVFLRTPDGSVMFMPTWHQQNMRLAAQLLGRHQSEVFKILWDVAVAGSFREDRWFRRYYTGRDNKRRFALHEAFFPGQVVDLNCCVPTTISDDDFIRLMNLAGQYKGLSPWSPGEFGQFVVEGLGPRRGNAHSTATSAGEERATEMFIKETTTRV